MNAHFCQEKLQQELEALANRTNPDGMSDLAGRAICAEARFDFNHTALDRAYEAHLVQHAEH